MTGLRDVWTSIEADFARALHMLPEDANGHEAIQQFQEFVAHNELELACYELERYAEEHAVPQQYWLALSDAAAKMQQWELSERYKRISNGSLTEH